MTEYGTIKIPRDEYERHNERRQELGQEWVEYIDGQAPQTVDESEIAKNILAEIRAESQAKSGQGKDMPVLTGVREDE